MKYNHGLIIGKFWPFHKGHQFLLETALSQSKSVSVIVCHSPKINIDPEIRAGWIKELYPKANVIIYRHDPELDSTSESISPIWAKITIELLGKAPDAVFTSEEYGERYSKFMGSHHVLVDMARVKVPISGTKVRSNPFKNWDYLSQPVKAFFAKRIVILGAESTGTTTLAKDLASHYCTTWVPEYGRTYCEGRQFIDTQSWNTKEFIHIVQVQNEMEEAQARQCNKLLICDTDAFATRLWHERYLGTYSAELEKYVNIKNKALYILTGDEIPFVQDGLRDGEHIRHQMHQKFISELKSHNLPYIIVTGTRKKRLKDAIKYISSI